MYFNMFYCGGQLWDPRPWLNLTKSDGGGIAIMEQKSNMLPIYIEHVYCGAANILKQEMLSIGGEVAVHKYAVNCKEQYGDVLVLGTYKEYKQLFKKLAAQHWKLKELGQELKITITNILSAAKDYPAVINDPGELLQDSFTPTGNIVQDMRAIQLTEMNKNKTLIHIDKAGLDLRSMQQYIYALQSKGHQVIMRSGELSEDLVVNFLKPNYFFN